ncbi:MAG: AMP-binding protein [Pseudomonadota bacterium]
MNSVAEAFQQHVEAGPTAPFLIPGKDTAISRAEAWAVTQDLGERLAGAGAAPGCRVSALVHKSPMAFLLYLACVRAGFVFHPMNPDYTDREVYGLIRDAKPTVIVCDSAREENAAHAASGACVVTLDADGQGSLLEARTAPMPRIEATPDGWAALLYTSGTTGKPKGAMLTHGNLLSNAEVLTHAWSFSPDDRLLHMLPIFHAHGLFVAGNIALVSGCAMLFEDAFSPDRFFERLDDATAFMAVPTLYGRLLADDRLTRPASRHMRIFTSGSAPLDAVAHDRFSALTGHRIVERYGMTETVMLTSNPFGGDCRAGSVGPALAGVDVRIRGADGASANASERGEVEVRGANVFKGYFEMPDKTAEAFTPDGFFKTGDIGSLSDDGYLTLHGRISDMIISGGYNVYPREVENALLAIEGISEAVAFGVPHPDFGEGVIAGIIADETAPDDALVIARVRETIAAYKSPKALIRLETFPKNAMGKVDRKALKRAYADVFGD